ncbi:MAG TPA: DUF1440 domain-containing protein [Actinomycetota bacterium]|nr:DUF1440 domain-containing protein [Actinomycetota bacterium]
MQRSLSKEIVLGTGAAYAASKVMDRVTTAYMEQQSESSKQREKELQDEPSYAKAAERLAELRGRDIDEQEAQRLGQRLHVGLGLSGGLVAGLLAARGMNPIAAGLVTGLGMWLLVDEAGNATLGLTPPATAYPRETHIRGLLGHLAYGGALGLLLAVGNTVFRAKKR